MSILVYESKEYTNINNPIIVNSKEVICPVYEKVAELILKITKSTYMNVKTIIKLIIF